MNVDGRILATGRLIGDRILARGMALKDLMVVAVEEEEVQFLI